MRRINTSLSLVFVFAIVLFGAYAFDGMAQAGMIQGTVKDSGPGNQPIPGIYVDAFEVNFGTVSTGCPGSPPPPSSNTTDAKGQFSFCVMNGIYKVFFRREATISYIGQWWNGASSYSGATPVNVPSGTTVTGVDAKMTYEGVGAIVSGQVTGPNGAALSGVYVSVYDYNQPVESKHGLAAGLSNISGNYVIGTGVGDIFSPLPPGTYKVKCNDHNSGNNNLIKWWNNKGSFLTADPFVITAGGANKADCKLSEGGIITGSVTDAANKPIAGASVVVYDQSQSSVTFNYTDATGV
jgi:hypothetical protein